MSEKAQDDSRKSSIKRIYNKESIALSLGRCNSLFFLGALTTSYQTIFLTQILSIPGNVYGIMSSVAAVVSAAWLFIAAAIIQRSNLPWGKYRSWLYIGGIGTFIVCMTMFTDWGLDNGALKYIIYGFCVICAPNIYNMCSAAGYGLIPVMVRDVNSRAMATSVMSQISNIAGLIINNIKTPLLLFFCLKLGETAGYTAWAAVPMTCLLACTFIFGHAAAPYDTNGSVGSTNEQQPRKSSASLKDMALSFFAKENFCMLAFTTFRSVANAIINSNVVIYYTYVINSLGMMAIYFSITAFITLGASLASPLFVKLLGARKTCIYATILRLAIAVGVCLWGRDELAFTLLLALGNFFGGICGACEVGYYSSCVHYTSLKRASAGKPDTSAFLMAMPAVSNKLASTLAPAITGFVLTAVAFDRNAITQRAASGLFTFISSVPVFLFAAAIVIIVLFVRVTPEAIARLERATEPHK